jgi:replicative DNA helicase
VPDAGPPVGHRKTPQDSNAERAILGAILLSPDSLDRTQEEGLSSNDFSQPQHQLLFATFTELARAGRAVDVVTVAGRLDEQGKLEGVGGYTYLSGLSGAVPSVANLTEYVVRVREKKLLRDLLDTASTISEEIYRGEVGAQDGLERAEAKILDLRQGRDSTKLVRLGDVVEEVYEQLRARAESPSDVTGIATGFRDLDKLLAGLQDSDLIIVAARPSMGKTAFSLNLAAHASLREGATIAFFSMEMSKEQIATRLLTSEARVNGMRMRTGQLRQDDWAPMLEAIERMDQAKVYVDDTPAMTVAGVRAKCRRLLAAKGLDLVVIDYLQLMRGDRNEPSREQEISAISRGLKALAKEFQVPVVALSQLNRGVEQRADKRPMMSDLRESGAIEQDADVIMFLYRDEVYNPSPDNAGLAEVLVRKQRNGAIGEVHLYWRAEFARFENLEHGYR